MTIPHYVNGDQSDLRAIKPGWYGMESNGKLSSGPFPNQERCLTGITQPRSNFRASPWRQANPAARKATMDYLDYVAHAGTVMLRLYARDSFKFISKTVEAQFGLTAA